MDRIIKRRKINNAQRMLLGGSSSASASITINLLPQNSKKVHSRRPATLSYMVAIRTLLLLFYVVTKYSPHNFTTRRRHPGLNKLKFIDMPAATTNATTTTSNEEL
jgi:hypothetical protein